MRVVCARLLRMTAQTVEVLGTVYFYITSRHVGTIGIQCHDPILSVMLESNPCIGRGDNSLYALGFRRSVPQWYVYSSALLKQGQSLGWKNLLLGASDSTGVSPNGPDIPCAACGECVC